MPAQLLEWLQQPFSPNMSATRWFLFVGLILTLLWAWHQVLREVSAVEADIT